MLGDLRSGLLNKVEQWRASYRYDRLPITRTSSVSASSDSSLGGSDLDKLQASTQVALEDVWEWIIYRRPLVTICMLAVSAVAISATVVTTLASVATVQGIASSCSDLDQPGWVAQSTNIDNHGSSQRRRHIQPLASQARMTQACADMWISQGELCPSILAGETPVGDTSVDVVWTFIEPTEHWQKWEEAYSSEKAEEAGHGTGAKHFRSFDEIRYSIRSVTKYMPFAEKMFLLGTSLSSTLPQPTDTLADAVEAGHAQDCRLTQVPEWMDTDSIVTRDHEVDSKLELVSYWDLFDVSSQSAQATKAWKNRVLPTFNSHSIESQLSHLPSTSETILYLNNDLSIGRPLSPADISTILFGPIFRIYPASWIHGVASPEEAMEIDGEGNARALPNTMRLLDERFGKRDRNYPEHIGYTLPRSIMNEVAQIWESEMTQTAEVRFRGRGPEYWLPLLVMYYTIEKQREALLWSYLMVRSDEDLSGSYSHRERQDLLKSLGGRREGDKLIFQTPVRPMNTERHTDLLTNAGSALPNSTNFIWSSYSAYPYVSKEAGGGLYPDYSEARQKEDFCTINIEQCFLAADFFERSDRSGTFSSEEIFKNVAFKQPQQCGDCLVAALLRQSGQKGFEAFLPRDQGQGNDAFTRTEVPQLGMSDSTWQDTNFGAKAAMGRGWLGNRWQKRDFCVRLIQRYSWTIGQSPTSFNELGDDPGWISWFLWRMKEDSSAFMGVNDHITSTNATIVGQIREHFMNWQEAMWPTPSIYEKTGA